MIVDTSALIAVADGEPGSDRLLRAMLEEQGFVPTPVIVEVIRVASGARLNVRTEMEELLQLLTVENMRPLPFSSDHARAAAEANATYGTGNGRGGTLNLLDLMVYGCAKVTGRPILCTGRDFAATDAAIHSASRAD